MAEQNTPQRLTPVCAIGASAGGLTALRRFFEEVGDDLGLAYVVVVHLSPDHPSALAAILSQCTKMPVRQVADSPRLRPNCVYVIPPDRELAIDGDDITARPFTEPRGQRAPIDMFFRSVAAARGDGAAIVLSGAGSDGSLGVRAIKEAGGVVFVQDPKEAEYPMMPRNAIATGAADFVLPIPRIAEQLAEVARSKDALRALELDTAADDLRRIVRFLRERTGHDFSSYKRATVMRRIARRMQIVRCMTFSDYADYMFSTPEEAQELFSDLLISVTAFFRDPKAYEALARFAVAPIFDEREDDRDIRVWVAGCATGEEAYSIGILFMEEAERRGRKTPIQIFASDLDEGALATAREGRYPKSIEADVSEARLKRFFADEGAHYRVRKELRDVVLFATHSVLKDPPFLRLDLVSCRNLMIYLERSLQRQLCTILHYGLNAGGRLFLGSAETIDADAELFTAVDRDARIYLARPRAKRLPPELSRLSHDAPRPMRERPWAARGDDPAGGGALHLAAIERAAPPSVLVDQARRIVNLSASAGLYILHSGGPMSAELPAIVRPELRLDLRVALDRAFSQKKSTVSLPAAVAFNGSRRRVVMQVRPVESDEHAAAHALVFFLDGGEIAAPVDDEEPAAARPDEVRRLHEELKLALEQLSASRRENEIAIEDLRAANEELQSINEEYRSTSEELETSKEELQSMNEELQTVNSELKGKLESISSAHSDLQNLIMATEIGTLFLDSELRIRMFTPAIAEIFNIAESDIGREITDFTHRMNYAGLEADARRVLRNLTSVETQIENADGHSYMMRIRPYRTIDDRIEGVCVTFIEITARLRAETRLSESEQRYQTLFNSIDEGFCVIEVIFNDAGRAVDYRFLDANAAFERQTGIADPIGRTMREIAQQHEEHWYETYGRVATRREPVRFEGEAAALGRYYEVFAFPVGDPAERNVGILFKDVSGRKEAEARLKLLVGELNHRVKNTLAVVQSIAHQTFSSVPAEDEKKAFEGRLASLAAAHSLLTQSDWRSASLRAVAEGAAEACGVLPRQMNIDGPLVELSPAPAVSFSMAIHELCTNAIKYGALSKEEGCVLLSWRVEKEQEPRLVVEWREKGGPPVAMPSRKGFGTIVVREALADCLDGEVSLDYASSGVVCVITAPLEHLGPGHDD